jgi:hypothetical protein
MRPRRKRYDTIPLGTLDCRVEVGAMGRPCTSTAWPFRDHRSLAEIPDRRSEPQGYDGRHTAVSRTGEGHAPEGAPTFVQTGRGSHRGRAADSGKRDAPARTAPMRAEIGQSRTRLPSGWKARAEPHSPAHSASLAPARAHSGGPVSPGRAAHFSQDIAPPSIQPARQPSGHTQVVSDGHASARGDGGADYAGKPRKAAKLAPHSPSGAPSPRAGSRAVSRSASPDDGAAPSSQIAATAKRGDGWDCAAQHARAPSEPGRRRAALPAPPAPKSTAELVAEYLARGGQITQCPGYGDGQVPHYDNRFAGLTARQSRRLMTREGIRSFAHAQRMRRFREQRT